MKFEQFSHKPLEEQFNNREAIEFPGGNVEVVDIDPETKKTEIPVLVAPGWTATAEVFKNNILTLAEAGRRTISISAPHGIETEEIENFPEAELRKVAAVTEILEEKNIEKIDAVGHSEAGIYLTIAATLHPEKFRNIVFVDSGGMIGEDKIENLSTRFSADTVQQIINGIKDRKLIKPMTKIFSEAGKSISSSPLKSLREVLAISDSQIHNLLRGLKKKGIGISIIHAVDDKAFPMDRVQQIAKADQLDGFYSVKGTHNQFVLKAKEYTQLADEALTALESKKLNKNKNLESV